LSDNETSACPHYDFTGRIALPAIAAAGELLAAHTGGRGGDRKSSDTRSLDSLAALGISRKQSQRSQEVAAVPIEEFDRLAQAA